MDEMDDFSVEETASQANDEVAAPPPPFYKRFIDVFFNPGRLGQVLREHPVWGVSMVVGAVLVAAMVGLIPAHVWAEMQRRFLLRAGLPVPETLAGAQTFWGWFRRPVSGAAGLVIEEFFYAGVITLIFAFVLGDEGRYRQYLAVVTHGWLVAVVIELLFVPLKISQANPQFSVSLGTFFYFLPQGYLLNVLNLITLSKLWTALVVAAGVHGIDPKRKFATAATVLIALSIAVSMVMAIFTPSMG